MLYFSIQNRLQDRTSKVPEAVGARWRFYRRIILGSWSESVRIVLLLAEAIHGVSAEILNLQISWQAHYLVRLEADCACSAHCKWRFICDADQSWDSFCVAGAVFAEVGGWHCLLCALEMKFHMKRGSNMRFILRGRRSIWWGSRLTLLAPRIVNDVSYVTRINHEIHFAWQAQYLVKLWCEVCCSAHCKWRFICDADQSWDSFFVAGAAFCEILRDSWSAKCSFSIQNASPRCEE